MAADAVAAGDAVVVLAVVVAVVFALPAGLGRLSIDSA